MTEKKVNPFLKCLFPIMDCISELFGENCEVVLHDITDPEHSIIKINNSHVTGRTVGAPLTDLAFEMIKSAEEGMEVLGNYNPLARNDRFLKSNAVNIRDHEGNLVGILCINLDVSQIQKYQQHIQKISQAFQDFAFAREEKILDAKDEHFENDLWSICQRIINEKIKEKGRTVGSLTKEERLQIVKILDEKGIFYFKGALHLLANALSVSAPTIYRYLEKSRLDARQKKSGMDQQARNSAIIK